MRANYNTRRTSVVFNPRGGVFGGLGAEEGYGTGAESYGGDIYGGGDTQAFIAAQIADENALVAAAIKAEPQAREGKDRSARHSSGCRANCGMLLTRPNLPTWPSPQPRSSHATWRDHRWHGPAKYEPPAPRQGTSERQRNPDLRCI